MPSGSRDAPLVAGHLEVLPVQLLRSFRVEGLAEVLELELQEDFDLTRDETCGITARTPRALCERETHRILSCQSLRSIETCRHGELARVVTCAPEATRARPQVPIMLPAWSPTGAMVKSYSPTVLSTTKTNQVFNVQVWRSRALAPLVPHCTKRHLNDNPNGACIMHVAPSSGAFFGGTILALCSALYAVISQAGATIWWPDVIPTRVSRSQVGV